MTASTPTATRARSRYALLLIPVVTGAAAGAYLDWQLWQPSSGIVVTVGAGGLLLVAGLAWSSRWKAVRPAAFWVAAFGIGLLLGQNFGPARPPVMQAAGTVTVELTEPANAEPITGRAHCQQTPGGDNFEISGDPNLRLQIGDQPLEERDPIQLALAKGDMWQYGAPRDDGWSLLIRIGDAGPFTDDQMPVDVTMESDGNSEIDGDGTQERGSLRFTGLVLDEQQSPGAEGPIELAGTIEWSCAS